MPFLTERVTTAAVAGATAEVAGRLILFSPDGSAWTIQVSDTGTVTAVKVS